MRGETPGMEAIILRRAVPTDAALACRVLIRSIREICAPDYGYDTALLERWCANKTVENVTQWITHPTNYFIVAAVSSGPIVGVGLLQQHTGDILLCYILPEVL